MKTTKSRQSSYSVLLFLLSFYGFSQNPSHVLYQFWEVDSWSNIAQEMHQYENGLPSNTVLQLWSIPLGEWQNYSQSSFINNTDGTIQQKTALIWDNADVAWKNYDRVTYTYSTSQKLLTTITELWNPLIPEFQNSRKTTYTYDGNDFKTLELQQVWNIGTLGWQNEYQTVYTNNPDGTVNTSLLFEVSRLRSF